MADSSEHTFSSRESLILHLTLISLHSWYNPADKSTTWEKPLALRTPFERALAETDWKEYTTKGRKYWVKKVSSSAPFLVCDQLTPRSPGHERDDRASFIAIPASFRSS